MKIGLIGDFIRDIYVYGKVQKISPESPVPVFQETYREERAGGAGNVMANLRALGSEVEFYGNTANSTKTRYVCDNHILFRSDDEREFIRRNLSFDFEDVKYVILSDYNKGTLHESQQIVDRLKKQGKFVIVDPKRPLSEYRGANIIKLNEKEFFQYGDAEDPYHCLETNNIGTMIITRAGGRVAIYNKDGVTGIDVDNHPVSDVTGAGDVFVAVLAHFLSKGDDIPTAAKKATILASISVTKFGTYTLTHQDIRKVTPKVIFTNGCFDILHRGHVEYLKTSKALGDKLIVGLNSDSSVKRLKGEGRPVNKQEDRKYLLECLDCVDEVIIFDEDTPYELIKRIRPDIITKGGDYKLIEDVVGYDLSEVRLIPFVENYSTTKILEKL